LQTSRYILTQLLLLTLLLSVCLDTSIAQPQATDRAIVRPRRVVLVRTGAIARDFPERKRAIVVYPVVSGLSDAAVLRRVRSALDIKNAFGSTLADYRGDAWLSEFGYKVNHNADYLLDITFTQNGVGAYPDDQEKHLLISLRDGSVVKAADVFEASKLDALAQLVDRELQREIAKIEMENLTGVTDVDERKSINDAYENLRFGRDNLDEFSVSNSGVTFLYDAGFPHVIKALEPHGRYFFGYKTLKGYIRRDGLLAKFRN
jgi:hypothetical protein